MTDHYNYNNIFAKILRKEIPFNKIYEDMNVLCFEDVSPICPIHWLVIPKKPYSSFTDFTSNAHNDEILNFYKSVNKIIEQHGLNQKGFRLVTNNGKQAGQTVFHFHVHILSGATMKELHI